MNLLSNETVALELNNIKYLSRFLLKFKYRTAIQLLVTNKRIIENNPKITNALGYRSWFYKIEDFKNNKKFGDSLILDCPQNGELLKLRLTSLIWRTTYSISTNRASEIRDIIKANS